MLQSYCFVFVLHDFYTKFVSDRLKRLYFGIVLSNDYIPDLFNLLLFASLETACVFVDTGSSLP